MFDLTPAVERARVEGKPVFLYLGAEDCGPCKAYSKFFKDNRSELAEGFSKVVFVDIRTSIKGPDVVFKVAGNRYKVGEFKRLFGDTNRSWTYPYFWLLSADLKVLKPMPWASGNYVPVSRQLEVPRLP